jgi:deoxyadenosine/deoxycytidine kinase
MIVNATDIDFVNNEEDFNNLVNEILKQEHSPIEYFNPGTKKSAG